MLEKYKSNIMFFGLICLFIVMSFLFVMIFAPSSFAGGYIGGDSSLDYVNAPAVGPNVVAYMFAEYLDPQTSYINLFVRRCECLKRLDYTNEGVFYTYPQSLTQEEFDGLTPSVLVGMIDIDGRLSTDLAGQGGLISVIERVLEYKKVGTRFIVRVSIKFVAEIQ